jgi:hypothetical protein
MSYVVLGATAAIVVFALATLHEIAQSLQVIARYCAAPKILTLEGPIRIRVEGAAQPAPGSESV